MRCVVPIAVASLALAAAASGQEIRTGEALAELGFPADTERQVLAGKFVRTSPKPTSDRELGVGLAFLVQVPPKKLVEQLRYGLLYAIDPNSKAHGALEGQGDLAQLAELRPSAAQLDAYASAKPGWSLDLSVPEIDAFRALAGGPPQRVEEQVRRSLLARYGDYRAAGLDGIAPYARGGGKQTDVAADLRRASDAAIHLKRHAPRFYEALIGYPKGRSEVGEIFDWQSYVAHGDPVFILTHSFAKTEGEAVVVCQRQFYVSGSYAAEQAVAGFLPMVEGTLVVYLNRTWTDQVAGFGSAGKRALGNRVLASQLEELFRKLQRAVEK